MRCNGHSSVFVTAGRCYGPLCAIVGLVLVSCSTTHYREAADRETYALVKEKTPQVPGMIQEFTIEPPLPPMLDTLPVNEEYREFLGEVEARNEMGARVLSLEKALELAFTTSREYQTRKENLYLQALTLTLERHRFDPIFSGTGSVDLTSSTRDRVSPNALGVILEPGRAASLDQALGTLTGTPQQLFRSYADVIRSAAAVTGANTTDVDIVREQNLSGRTNLGFSMLLESGARLALNLTTNFLRFVTGDPRESAASVLSGSLTQPLLRGGHRVTIENLTQAERNLLYEVRDFTRFRQTFAVRVASDYYNVLSSLDSAKNNYEGLRSNQLNLDRTMAFFNEGLATQVDVGRQEQSRLSREAAWINAVNAYKRNLDNFKILLGLSTDSPVILDSQELVQLRERGIIHPHLTDIEAQELALVTRLDLYISRDQVEDAERRVEVAADQLKPGLDLVLTGQVNANQNNQPLNFDFERAVWSIGVDTDLPFDRKSERNAYRRALIDHERAKRNLMLAEDQVKLDIREAWRALERTKRNYEINLQAVQLNESRVEEQQLRQEVGLVTDVLAQVEAQNDLVTAQNNLTRSLIDHTLARLQFWRDIGILFIKENGQWEEVGNDQDS